jgi:hypothetical protein
VAKAALATRRMLSSPMRAVAERFEFGMEVIVRGLAAQSGREGLRVRL